MEDTGFFPPHLAIGPTEWNSRFYTGMLATLGIILIVLLIAATLLASEAVALSLLSTRRCFPALDDWWWMYCGHIFGLLLLLLLLLSITRLGYGTSIKLCFFPEEYEEIRNVNNTNL